MPTDTSDQQITMPVGADVADNPVAFSNAVTDIETRLALRYTSAADRAARHPVGIEAELSHLADVNRMEVFDGTNWISLYPRSLHTYARKDVSQALTSSSTVLQDVTILLAALPAAGTFGFSLTIYYDTPAAADIKFAFTIPAGATMRWGVNGAATGGGSTGDGVYSTATGSDVAIACGGAGAGTVLMALVEGDIIMGGTAGNLQLRAAQNTADAGATSVQTHSRMQVWRSA